MATILFTITYFAGAAAALLIPAWVKRRHVRRQTRLLERCRVLYLLAVKAIEAGDETSAREGLRRIELIERQWRYGKSFIYLAAKMVYAIALGAGLGVGLRLAALAAIDMNTGGPAGGLFAPLVDKSPIIPISLGLMACMHALHSWFGEWSDPYSVADLGERLSRLLDSGRAVVVGRKQRGAGATLDGLSARQIFGLGPDYSRADLERARRRLAFEFHPDRWQRAPASVRAAREEAMKRVNAAHEQLKR